MVLPDYRLAVDLAFRDQFPQVLFMPRAYIPTADHLLVFIVRRYLPVLRLQLFEGSLYVPTDLPGYGCDLGMSHPRPQRTACMLN